VFSLLGALLGAPCAAQAQDHRSKGAEKPGVILGVLEDRPGHYAGEPNFRAVRILFQKLGNKWEPFQSDCHDRECLRLIAKDYPQQISWTVAFDGKEIGRISTQAPDDFAWYSDVGLERITGTGPVPTLGERSQEFSGWLSEPVYRPLVAVSKPNFSDPGGWKRTRLLPEQIAELRIAFRRQFAKVSNCKSPEENTLRPWNYRDEKIGIGAAYSSVDHWILAELNLTGYACDGPAEDGSPFEYQWYVVAPSGNAHFLASDMWLVDTGDYDNDGASEILFAVDAYNKDGYRLYYSNFSRHAEFVFNYQ
jgi:hypothetical protein